MDISYNYISYRFKEIIRKDTYMVKDFKVPDYYIGLSGRDVESVLNDFGLNDHHHLASATEYILRCQKKHDSPIEDITKAIHHLMLQLKVEEYKESLKLEK